MSSWINDTDKAMLAKYLIGGAGLGAAAGTATSLINHLKSLNHEAGRAADTSGDDDVIYVNIPRKKPQVKLAVHAAVVPPQEPSSPEEPKEPESATGLGYTLALAGLPLAAVGSYSLVDGLYKKFKKKRLQAQLDEAQQVHLDLMSKRANGPVRDQGLNPGNMIYSLPAAALLTALASGVLTNKVLDKQFPLPQRAQSTKPKRLVVREEPEEMIKEQSVHDDAYEGLLRTVLQFPETVRCSGLSDLVKAAAAGRCEEILRASDESPDLVFELVKCASADVPDIKLDLATAWLVREPETAAWVKLAAALEYFEHAPMFCALARELDDEAQDQAVKAAAEFCRQARAEKYLPFAKAAHLNPAPSKAANHITDLLQEALENSAGGKENDVAEGSDERDPEVVLGNASSVDSREDLSKPSLHTRGNKARKFADTNKDLIDDVFAPEKPDKVQPV